MAKHAVGTHVGRIYDHNEDSVRCHPESGLYLVADGMGGHASGEVASRIAADEVVAKHATMPLSDALRMAHQAVVTAAGRDAALKGMGSTVVAAIAQHGRLTLSWVGDSRGYLYRQGELRRVTRDHSLVNLLLDRKEVTEAQARNHPQKNVITQTLGHGDPDPSQVVLALRNGDWLLLCSDGLNDELADADIRDVLAAADDLEGAVATLVDRALAGGGRDNISAVLVEFDSSDTGSWWSRARHVASSLAIRPVLAGVAVAAAAALIFIAVKMSGGF